MSKSSRKELQGPRPAPLKIRKDSHKIRKPPLAPQPAQKTQPVIIYTVSPKVIHTNPNDFMNLVQRLTGSTSSSSGSSSLPQSTSDHPFNVDTSGAISPAARFASIEKAKSPEGKKQQSVDDHIIHEDNFGVVEGIEMNQESYIPGILSPAPTLLPPISPNFFSPPDTNSINSFHDLSPVPHGDKTLMEGSFMPSPSSFNTSTYSTSPITPSIDLFNHFFDL